MATKLWCVITYACVTHTQTCIHTESINRVHNIHAQSTEHFHRKMFTEEYIISNYTILWKNKQIHTLQWMKT